MMTKKASQLTPAQLQLIEIAREKALAVLRACDECKVGHLDFEVLEKRIMKMGLINK